MRYLIASDDCRGRALGLVDATDALLGCGIDK